MPLVVQDANLVPVFVRELVSGMPPLDPTAVDQNTNIMTILQDLLHESLDLVPVSQIRGINRRCSSKSTNLISRVRIAFVSLYQDHIGSGFGQCERHGLADASRGTGDERGLAM